MMPVKLIPAGGRESTPARPSALKSQFHLLRFCPHLGCNDSPVWVVEELFGSLDVWLVFFFIRIPMKPLSARETTS